MNEPSKVIVAIEQDGDEALYVNGELKPTEGPTVYAVDIADAVGDQVIQFSHVAIDRVVQAWPEKFESLATFGSYAAMEHGVQAAYDAPGRVQTENAASEPSGRSNAS